MAPNPPFLRRLSFHLARPHCCATASFTTGIGGAGDVELEDEDFGNTTGGAGAVKLEDKDSETTGSFETAILRFPRDTPMRFRLRPRAEGLRFTLASRRMRPSFDSKLLMGHSSSISEPGSEPFSSGFLVFGTAFETRGLPDGSGARQG